MIKRYERYATRSPGIYNNYTAVKTEAWDLRRKGKNRLADRLDKVKIWAKIEEQGNRGGPGPDASAAGPGPTSFAGEGI